MAGESGDESPGLLVPIWKAEYGCVREATRVAVCWICLGERTERGCVVVYKEVFQDNLRWCLFYAFDGGYPLI